MHQWTLPVLQCLTEVPDGQLFTEELRRPLSIGCVQDGRAYALSPGPAETTNLFLKAGCVDDLYIKVPSERGFGDYRRFIRFAARHPDDIRGLEPPERFENLDETLRRWGGFESAASVNVEIAHYLAVHRLQHERLRGQAAVGIPAAKFALLRSTRFGFLHKFEPVLFQERIPGVLAAAAGSGIDYSGAAVLRFACAQ